MFGGFTTAPILVSAIGPSVHRGTTIGLLHSCNCFGKDIDCGAFVSPGSSLGTGLRCAIGVHGPCFVSAMCCHNFDRHAAHVVRLKHQHSLVDSKRRFGITSLSKRHAHVDALLHGINYCCFHPSCLACRTSAVVIPGKRIRVHLVPIPNVPGMTRGRFHIKHGSICLLKGRKRRPGSDVSCGNLAVRCCGGPPMHPGVLCH